IAGSARFSAASQERGDSLVPQSPPGTTTSPGGSFASTAPASAGIDKKHPSQRTGRQAQRRLAVHPSTGAFFEGIPNPQKADLYVPTIAQGTLVHVEQETQRAGERHRGKPTR